MTVMGFRAIVGFIPGILKARLGVNEILSTVMLNAIALQLMNLLLRGPLIDPAGVAAGTFLPQSARLPQQVWLTARSSNTAPHRRHPGRGVSRRRLYLPVAHHHRISHSGSGLES
jgi:ABC-type uncharacterized transport system permease subunit